MLKMFGWIAALLVIGLLAFIRLAPSDPARWHVPVTATENADHAGGAVRVISGGAQEMAALRDIALQTPRTSLLAGSPEEGLMTFVTRSKWMGFPDYTTVQSADGQIRIYARLRFGQSDLGVNKARLEGWLAELGG